MNEGHAYIMPPLSMVLPTLASGRARLRVRPRAVFRILARGLWRPHAWSEDRGIHREVIASLTSPLVCGDIPTIVMVHTSLVGEIGRAHV